MITGLKLGNFKAFSETQHISIRPLTLIFGPNSSGKSSLIHGLILARHAMETGELDVHRTQIGGESVDLGGFRQYVHRRDSTRRVEWGIEIDTAKLEGRLAEMLSPVRSLNITITIGMENPKGDKDIEWMLYAAGISRYDIPEHLHHIIPYMPFVITYEVEADSQNLLRMSRRPDGKMQLDRLENKHQVFRQIFKAILEITTTAQSFTEDDFKDLDEVVNELVPKLTARTDKFLPSGLQGEEKLSTEPEQRLMFPISKGNRQDDIAAAVRFFLPHALNDLIEGLHNELARELSRFQYLGPLRSYPPRHFAFTPHHDPNWYAGGGYAWDVVRTSRHVRGAVNSWLGSTDRLQTPYALITRDLVPMEDCIYRMIEWLDTDEGVGSDEIIDILNFEDKKIEQIKLHLYKSSLEKLPELVMIDQRTNTIVSHRDIGIGISQVLPVLVAAYASQNRIVAIEQPEIHLHPALQAELGDVFIESALGKQKNTFLLETHSEHLILRILRRIRETSDGTLKQGLTPLTPNDVTVIYAKPDSKGSTLTELHVTEDGDFADKWPDGFFEERAEELF